MTVFGSTYASETPLRHSMKIGICLSMVSSHALADRIQCQMENGDAIRFEIDPNQFVDAVDPGEPIRRKVTKVDIGDTNFLAEPFVIEDLFGFSAESIGGGTMMMVIDEGGNALLSDLRQGIKSSGTCEVFQ